jgi:hypothetical protein
MGQGRRLRLACIGALGFVARARHREASTSAASGAAGGGRPRIDLCTAAEGESAPTVSDVVFNAGRPSLISSSRSSDPRASSPSRTRCAPHTSSSMSRPDTSEATDRRSNWGVECAGAPSGEDGA